MTHSSHTDPQTQSNSIESARFGIESNCCRPATRPLNSDWHCIAIVIAIVVVIVIAIEISCWSMCPVNTYWCIYIRVKYILTWIYASTVHTQIPYIQLMWNDQYKIQCIILNSFHYNNERNIHYGCTIIIIAEYKLWIYNHIQSHNTPHNTIIYSYCVTLLIQYLLNIHTSLILIHTLLYCNIYNTTLYSAVMSVQCELLGLLHYTNTPTDDITARYTTVHKYEPAVLANNWWKYNDKLDAYVAADNIGP